MSADPSAAAAAAAEPTQVLDTAAAGGHAIRGGAVRAAGYVFGALLTLASAPLLFRHLGVVEFGRYTSVLSLIALVSGVTEAGLGAVTLREYSVRSGVAREAFMRNALGTRLVLTLAGVAVATLFAVAAGYGRNLVLGTVLAGMGAVLATLQGTLAVPLAAGLRLGWITVGDFLRAALNVVLVVAFVLAGANVVAFLAIPVPTGIALVLVTALLVRRIVPLRPTFHFGELRALLADTLPLAVATVLSTLYFRIVIVLMSLIATALQTGYFATSYRVTEVLAGLPVLLVSSTFPILSRAAHSDRARLGYAVQRVFEIALIGGVWMSMVTAIGAHLAVTIIGGHEAAPAAGVLRIQAFALAAVFLNLTWQFAMLSLHRHRELLVVNGLALGVIVVLAFALVPPLQAHGAALAVVGGETFLMSASAVALFRAQPDLRLSLRVAPRVAVATLLAVGPALLLPMPDATRVVLASVIYAAALAALDAIPTELRGALLRRATPAS